MDAVFLLHRDSAKNEGRMKAEWFYFLDVVFLYILKVFKSEEDRRKAHFGRYENPTAVCDVSNQ